MKSQPFWVRARFPLLLLGGLALMAGLWAGLLRMGWRMPPLQPGLAASHGPLMISGFLGTVICLERAVALNRGWTYAAPLLAGLGSLAVLVGLPPVVGQVLILVASAGLVAIFIAIYRLHPALPAAVMGLGALLWLVGNGLWLRGDPLFQVVPWWAGFLVITIAGERLELSRLLLPQAASRLAFLVAVGLFVAGLLVSLGSAPAGVRVAGAGLAGLGLWLLRYDVARRTIRRAGLARFIAACLLPGYVWLIVAGGLWMVDAPRFIAGPTYDAMLHIIFLGFVFSMIFGHEPIIVPAMLQVELVYSPTFYSHLILLHLSLVLRVLGDLLPNQSLRLWGGLINVVAILLFIGNTVRATRGGRQQSSPSTRA